MSVELSNIKFQEDPSSWSTVPTDGQTDGRNEDNILVFSAFLKRLKASVELEINVIGKQVLGLLLATAYLCDAKR